MPHRTFSSFTRTGFTGARLLIAAWTLLVLLAGIGRAAGVKPPSTGELYSYGETLNLDDLSRDAGVTAGITDLNGTKMIKIDFPLLKGYPGVNFPVPAGGWDLTGYAGVQIQVHNPGTESVAVTMKLENPAGLDANPWNADIVSLDAGATKTLKVTFGKSFGQWGFALDATRVAHVRLYTQALTKPVSIVVGKPTVFKGVAAAATGAAPSGGAAGVKPPSTGELYSYEGTLNLGDLWRDAGVVAGITDLNGVKMIKIDFPLLKGYPGVNFPVPKGGWDLSGYGGVQIPVHNPGTESIAVSMKLENPAGADANPWNADIVSVDAGATKTLKVTFGKSFGQQGFPLDATRVAHIRLYTQALTKPVSIMVGKPMAVKGAAGAAAAPEVPSLPYVTKTTSPKNHAVPYGQEWELVKDWTFGNKRADATIRNKGELDKEFYYRYIYENGKLDILSTFWSYHRDYPEGDPKSLHVFGDDTLTLKGRIPEGGGLRMRGIESGLLRAKTPFVPGMYVEMRCKVTRGVGSWPSFWLNPGIQYDDGTFSKLPWPPEIDIFEFFGFKNNPKAATFESNIQVNKKPAQYGNPRDIFTAYKKGHYTPGMDFSEEFHVFALDWQEDRPVWLLDGHPIKQTYYKWPAPAAHILIGNQLGIEFAKDDMKAMTADESNWDFVIDYVRVWKHPGVVVPSTVAAPAPAK
ncbi:MAG: family 16 glycosylhydrolase [Opitutaceae bacterium]